MQVNVLDVNLLEFIPNLSSGEKGWITRLVDGDDVHGPTTTF
jgi:hypothetical protein